MRTDESVVVRNLRASDLDAVIELDRRITHSRRRDYFEKKLAEALSKIGIRVSLAAEVDGRFAGFLLAKVYYGEFGATQPEAVLDTIGVDPDARNCGVAGAMMRQLRQNLLGLGIRTLRTEVEWKDQALLAWFHRCGFEPSHRFVLDLDLEQARRREEAADAIGEAP
ncbi:MAG: hypothetical protein Fur0037_24650 [Planctomycetota bacterium]